MVALGIETLSETTLRISPRIYWSQVLRQPLLSTSCIQYASRQKFAVPNCARSIACTTALPARTPMHFCLLHASQRSPELETASGCERVLETLSLLQACEHTGTGMFGHYVLNMGLWKFAVLRVAHTANLPFECTPA